MLHAIVNRYKIIEQDCLGVATGWTGVDMSTPLLPEIVPEIDANPVSFHSGEGVGVSQLTRV